MMERRYMAQGDVITILREALWTILKLASPLLLVSLILGLVIAIFQAATQIHEQTLTFVPKILAVALLLVVIGNWMMTSLTDFFMYICMRILEI
jgi:flagellar biosynthetic protein FliQ